MRRDYKWVQNGQKCSSTVNSRNKTTTAAKPPISGEVLLVPIAHPQAVASLGILFFGLSPVQSSMAQVMPD